MVLTLLFAFLLAIAAAIFALQNPTLVAANFFGYKVEGSLALFVLIGLAVGFLIGLLVMTPGRIKSSLSNARYRKRIAELEAGLEQKAKAPSEAKEIPPSVEPPSPKP
jgi:uncharacterized integral membrane protein